MTPRHRVELWLPLRRVESSPLAQGRVHLWHREELYLPWYLGRVMTSLVWGTLDRYGFLDPGWLWVSRHYPDTGCFPRHGVNMVSWTLYGYSPRHWMWMAIVPRILECFMVPGTLYEYWCFLCFPNIAVNMFPLLGSFIFPLFGIGISPFHYEIHSIFLRVAVATTGISYIPI